MIVKFKKIQIMKRFSLITMLCAISMGIFAQNKMTDGKEKENMQGKQNKEYRTNPDNSTWKDSKTNKFVKKAMMDGMMERQLGMMAQERGNSKEVRDLGMMLAKNHADADMKLQNIAKDMNINVPEKLDREHKKKLDEMKTKSSNEFSREFVNMVIKDHKEDISKFKKAGENVANDELDNWIDKNIPVLEKHLSSAQDIQKNKDKQSD